MAQIVKMFIRPNYFIEDDLVVDYTVEKEAQLNVSPKDWIALIPKGWSGVDEQVVFKTVGDDYNVNLAIKSVAIETNFIQNVVECQKQYQLLYISQYLEIFGKSDYFVFVHQFGTCNCVFSLNTGSKENVSHVGLSSITNQRQPATQCKFYKNQRQSQDNVSLSEDSKSKLFSSNILLCTKCNAPDNFTSIESAYITKIEDLTKKNELIEKNLFQVQKDLVSTLEVANKQFKLRQIISQQKENIKNFTEELIEGLMTKGKITFWAYNEEFTVTREFLDKDKLPPTNDDTVVSLVNKSLYSSSETYLKAIIGQQEKTIQHLVIKLKDMCEYFFKANMLYSNEQDNSTLTSSENKIYNMPYCIESLNENNMYISNDIKNNNSTKKIDSDESIIHKWLNNTTSNIKFPDVLEPKVISTLNAKVEDKILTFEDWKKDKNEYTFSNKLSQKGTDETVNEFDNVQDSTDGVGESVNII